MNDDELLALAAQHGIKVKTPKASRPALAGPSDDELLSMAQSYGIKVKKPRQATVQPSEPSDEELLGMAQSYGIKTKAPSARPVTQVQPMPYQETGSSQFGDWAKNQFGFNVDSAMAPLRRASYEQSQLTPGEQAQMKLGAAGKAALDLADIAPNLISGMHPEQWANNQLDPRMQYLKLLPYAADASRKITSQGRALINQLPAVQKAPEAFKSYADLAANIGPMPNLSGASLAAKAGLPMWENAIKAGRFLPAVADNALAGAGVASAYGSSQDYEKTGKIDPLSALLKGGEGALFGGAGGALLHGAGKVFGKVMSHFKNKPAQVQHQVATKLNQAMQPSPPEEGNLQWLVDNGLVDINDPEQLAILGKGAPEVQTEVTGQILPSPVPEDSYVGGLLQDASKQTQPTAPEAAPAPGSIASPDSPSEFRYTTDKYGYQRNEDFGGVNALPASRLEKVKLRRIAELGRDQKYLSQLFEAKVADYARKYGEDNWLFDEFGIKGGISLEPNLGRQHEAELEKLRFELANGTYDKAPQGVRGLSESAYGQSKDWLPSELPGLSNDKAEAMADLIATRRQYLEAQKAFSDIKDQNKDLVFQIQDRLREANPQTDGQPPQQLQALFDLPHPAGPQYGRVKYGVETYQHTLGLALPPAAKAVVEARRAELVQQVTGGISADDWQSTLKGIDDEISTNGGLSPINEVQRLATERAQEEGFPGTRAPYKLEIKFSDWRRAAQPVKERATKLLESRAAKGSLMAAALGILSQLDNPAEAADGKQQQVKSNNGTPIVAALLALGLYVGGVKSTQKIGARMGKLAAVGNIWRDTMDMVKMLDAEAGTNFEPQVWKHLAGSIQATWGVHFDNPEQLLQAIQELKKSPNGGAAFQALPARNQAALRHQKAVKQNLNKGLARQIEAIEARMDPQHPQTLAGNDRAKSGLHTLKQMQAGLMHGGEVSGAMDQAYHAVLGNIMDYFFFWNPEYHLTNFTDQFIAGGSMVGLHNIVKANMLLNGVGGVGGDIALRQKFTNSNLIGGIRVERAEQKAITSGKPQSGIQKFMNTDIPSDQINADRIALASFLEYFQLNKGTLGSMGHSNETQFVKDLMDGKVDPSITMDAWIHMTERVSRITGADPLRINKDWLSRQKIGSMFVFFKQPARVARMMTRYIADNNYKGLATLMGMAALFGGRAAMPTDLAAIWSQLDPDSYFKTAAGLDAITPYKLTGENNASKLTYGLGYLGTGSGNIVLEMGGQAATNMQEFLDASKVLMKHPGSYESLPRKSKDEINKATQRMIKSATPLVMPRIPFIGLPTKGVTKALDNQKAVTENEKKIYFYENGKQWAKTQKVNLKKAGVSALDMAKDLIVPGTPIPFDQVKMMEEEKRARKKALIPKVVPPYKQAYTYPRGK